MAAESIKERFVPVSLSFNIGALEAGDVFECNPGGSVFCTHGTAGCLGGAMTCQGSSCSGKSATIEAMFDARILIERGMIEKLQTRIQEVVSEFTR